MPTKGPRSAPIEIVVFEDFQCPFCKKLAGNVEVLRAELKDEVRVAFMHFPMNQKCNANELKKSLHRYACIAAQGAVCAQQQGRFWEMHDELFRNNANLGGRDVMEYARVIGLDTAAFRDCLDDDTTLAKIRKDSEIGGKAGVGGTPSLFINGRRLVGAQPVSSLKAAIEALKGAPEGRVLLDVEDAGEIIGEVDADASMVEVKGAGGTYLIDAFEASIADGKARSVPGVAPARSTTWYEAKAACEAAGKRLCTEEEWLGACTGEIPVDADKNGIFSDDRLGGRQHSYGEYYREGWCADDRKKGDPTELLTGNHPKCRTPSGIYDLEGVTKEWVGLTPDRASVKGGSYYSGTSARCAYHKDSEAPDTRDDSIGFRCCNGGDVEEDAVADRYPGGKVGDAIQQFALPRLGGGEFGTKDLKGKPFIMTFWASWCGPCKKELPALAELYSELGGQGLQIVGVNVDQNRSAAESWLAQNPLPFPVILDTRQEVMDRFDTRGVPSTFWVKRDGTIRQRTIGYDEGGKAKLTADAQRLLRGE